MKNDKSLTIRTTWFDDVVGWFDPLAGLKRANARLAFDTIRRYDAAAKGRRTEALKGATGTSVNAETWPALDIVRARVRHLVRNNTHASRAVTMLTSYVVGEGIRPEIDAPGTRQKSQLRAVWKDWSESTDCDADGTNNFYGLQALAMRTTVESGEALVLRHWRTKKMGFDLTVPMQLRVLEGDYIDTLRNRILEDEGYIIQGIEYSKDHQRRAYWLFDHHPGDISLINARSNYVSTRIDAKDVLHLYRADRAGQVRGMSWGSACVVRMQDLDAFEDAQLLRQRIAACFAGFIRDLEAPADIAVAKEKYGGKLEAGALEILPPGKTIEFPNLPLVTNDGHSERVLRSIAMGWGLTYEGLSGDFSNVNYSSFRGAMLDFKRQIGPWQQHMFIPRFCNRTFDWFKDACEFSGLANISGASTSWTVPKYEMIDPTKEVPATIAAIRGGIMTLPEAVREQGYDFESHVAEIKRSNDALDAAGIILDSDPRNTQKAGGFQQDPNAAGDAAVGAGDTTKKDTKKKV